MDARLAKGFGACSVAGALAALVAAVPAGWYGYRETDAYVFDPAAFSPAWIDRHLVPLLALLAGVLLLVGLAGLVARDRPVARRLRVWSGSVAVAGIGLLVVAALLFYLSDAAAAGGADELTGALFVLAGLLTGLAGAALSWLGLVAAGVGYALTDRPRVGYALVGGPVLAALIGAAGYVVDVQAVGGLPVVLPLAAAFAVVGHDLWTHREPLEDPEDPPSGTDDEEWRSDVEEGARDW